MSKEDGAIDGTPPNCNLESGCPAYQAHFDASTERGLARYEERLSRSLEEEGSDLAGIAKKLANSDKVAAQILEQSIEKMRKNNILCRICPYRL